MNRNWQYTKRRLSNSFRLWRAEHLTLRKVTIATITVLIFIMIVPLLIYFALGNDVQNVQISGINQVGRQDKLVIFGLDPAQDIVTLKQQLSAQIPQLWLAYERQQYHSLIVASPRQFMLSGALDLQERSLAVIPDSYDAWSLCNQLQALQLNNVVIVADSLDVPKIGYVCKNLGLQVRLYAQDVYPALTRGGLFVRSLIETVRLVWQVNSSTISV